VGAELQANVQYLSQRKSGAMPDGDSARWMLVWTAPQSTAPVTFHIAANAADGDGTAEGDYVYTTAVESAPSTPR
jgi:hypothetical protein